MTDIEQREPVAALTIDCTGCEHLSRDVANIERIAAAGSEGPTSVHHLYTGQQLAEVEALVKDLEEVIKMMANVPPVIQMPTLLKGADTAEQRVAEMASVNDALVAALADTTAEAERLRALVEEAKAIDEALEASGRRMANACYNVSQKEWAGGQDMADLRQAHEEWDNALRAALALRDRLEVEG